MRRMLFCLRTPIAACVTIAAVLCTPESASAHESPPTPLEVRAVFLLHLARFVKWPEPTAADPRRTFVIGHVVGDPIAVPLRQIIQGETIADRPIELCELRGRADLERCDLVYLGNTLNSEFARAIGRQRDRPVLFVGDADNLLGAGGHVQFYQRGNQVRLRISPDNLRAVHLVPNSQLLRVATVR